MERYIRFFIKDKLLVNMIVIFVFLMGGLMLSKVNREKMPQTAIDKMAINVVYPGASPVDVELNAVVPIEEELSEIVGIADYKSIIIEGASMTLVELDQSLDEAEKQEVKDDVFRLITTSNITDLPSDVDNFKLSVTDINSKLISVFKIGLAIKDGGGATDGDLYNKADILEKKIRRVEGVSDVDVHGYLERKIHIKVDASKMNDYYVSLSDIVDSISKRNVRSTGGTLQSVYNEKNIVTLSQFDNPFEVKDVIIRSAFEQRQVRVRDVATVYDEFEEPDKLINVNGEKCVVFNIKKKVAADTIKTTARVKEILKDFKDSRFDISTVANEADSVSSLVGVVFNNATIGFVLVFLVLLIFLDFKTSFWTAASIPFCMFLVIIFMRINNYSLNSITIGAIVTVLGMMVDDAIVIAEVIYDRKKSGMSGVEAAISGATSVFYPVVVSILTTIFAFVPMLFIQGTMGKFIFVFPIIVSVTLLFSLFEAITILPNHLAHESKIHLIKRKFRVKATNTRDHWFVPVMRFYKKVLKGALRFRYAVLLLFVFIFIGTIFISKKTIQEFVLFWDNSNEYLNIDLDFEPGISLEKTNDLTQKLEKIIVQYIPKDELVSTFSQSGTHSGRSMDHDYWSTIQLKLVPINERNRTANQVGNNLRKYIQSRKLKYYKSIFIREEKGGPPTGEPVDIKIISSSKKEAIKVMNELRKILSSIKGVKDIDTDLKDGKKELYFKFNYAKMAQYGMDVETIASTIRIAYEGSTATSVQNIDDKLDFIVKLQDKYKANEKYLLDMLIPNSSGRLVKLKEVASLGNKDGESEIIHYNGDRSISVTADVVSEIITPLQVNKIVKEEYSKISQKYDNTYLLYEGEFKESQEAMSDLKTAFILAMLMIYLIIVFLFRSLTQPIVVMSVIPFGLIGVLIAFTIHGIPLSFMALIGVLGLAGVVVNDSILMVSFINNTIKEKLSSGEDVNEGISEGASQRLRAIIMTTVTTVAGLLPTVYGFGGDAQMLVPIVMAMAYGLIFATFLTLLFVPCLYMINEDIRKITGYIKERFNAIFTPPASGRRA